MSAEKRTGAELIAAERDRQITDEGWTLYHDDEHSGGELLAAAICYAQHRVGAPPSVPPHWPWEPAWWKPRSPIDNLVRAGALLAAEIDRLQRRIKHLDDLSALLDAHEQEPTGGEG